MQLVSADRCTCSQETDGTAALVRRVRAVTARRMELARLLARDCDHSVPALENAVQGGDR